MKILFITLAIKDLTGNGLYVDLLRELKNRENDVYVVCPVERRYKESTNLIVEESISFLRAKTGNITKTNFIEKGISTLLIEKQFTKSIKSFYCDICFDLVIYTTPPVTFEKVINYVKKRDKCLSYLVLKDIFPQNAVDLEILKKTGVLYKYFRMKEKKLYNISDYIGCTSNRNIEYVKKHNPEINPSRIELFPNSVLPRSLKSRNVDINDKKKKYGIPMDSIIFVYGGNIGRPQGIDFIKKVITRVDEKDNLFFMIFGSGTDFNNLSNFINKSGFHNVNIMQGLSKDEYWDFLTCCDVGLIFLDSRFTVPNTPARLTYYMEAELPILAATDKHTDIEDILKEANCGFWVESGDIENFYSKVDLLLSNPELRDELGKNGRKYMENNFHISRNYEVLMNHLKLGEHKNV
jgi:glycosyltransferase involved in cell wall biosynthesis